MLKMLFFYGTDGPSIVQGEFVKNIEVLFKGKVEVKKISTKNDKEIAEKYDVNEAPAVIIEKNGRVSDKFSGLTQELFLKRALERNL